MVRIIGRAILLVGVSVGLTGCGSGVVIVKGKVSRGGKPVEVKKNESLNVSFSPLDTPAGTPGNAYSARMQPDGSFDVIGIHRKGIPKGWYRVSVQIKPSRGNDRLEGKFSGPNSPIVRNVTGAEVHIDLDNPTAEGG